VDKAKERQRSHLFTVRIWSEVLGGGQTEWRGQVRHVTSGETRYFRDWSSLVTYLVQMLEQLEGGEDDV
jgi:hypothetical protein